MFIVEAVISDISSAYRAHVLHFDFPIASFQHVSVLLTIDKEHSHVRVTVDEILADETRSNVA